MTKCDDRMSSRAVFPIAAEEVLTEEEAVKFLRLDSAGVKHPARTLARYAKQGLLRRTQVGPYVRYLKSELVAFLHRQTEVNPR